MFNFSKIKHLDNQYGLPRPWKIYCLFLMAQAIVAITTLHIEYGFSRRGVIFHLFFLYFLVIALYLIANPLKRFSLARKYIIPISLGAIQLILLLIYIAAFIGFQFTGSPPSFEMLFAYTHSLQQLAELAGISVYWITSGLLFFFFISSIFSIRIFKNYHVEYINTRWLWLTLGILFLLYALTQPWSVKGDILHDMYFGNNNFTMAPKGLLSNKKPLMPTYLKSNTNNSKIKTRPLVLITVDALRSDAMQVYGNATLNTPFLSSLFASGQLQRLENARSICTFSYCGLVGLLSSQYWSQLDRTPYNLPDALHENGYENHFLLSGDHVHFHRLRRQYGDNIKTYLDSSIHSGGLMNDDYTINHWLTELKPENPDRSFLYLHLMSVHSIGVRDKKIHAQVVDSTVNDHRLIGGEDLGKRVQSYNDGIVQADESIRKIFAWLKSHNWLDDALIIITADHGESLGEFNTLGHGGLPFEPVTRIPLLIFDKHALPFPKRVIYSQVDVAPTFLEAIGAPIPMQWSGIPLQRPTERCAVPINSFNAKGVVGVVNGVPLKYLEIKGAPPRRYLFDLRKSEDGQPTMAGTTESKKLVSQLSDCSARGFQQ